MFDTNGADGVILIHGAMLGNDLGSGRASGRTFAFRGAGAQQIRSEAVKDDGADIF